MRPGRQSPYPTTLRTTTVAALCASLVAGAYLASVGGETAPPVFGWVAMLPLLAAVRVARPVGAAAAGALWGTAFFAFSAWLGSSGRAEQVALARLLLLAGAPAAYACGGAWLTRRIGFSPFVLGVAWMGVELALGPAGLRPGVVEGTGLGGAVLDQMARALGYVFVAFLVAYANAVLVAVLSGVCEPAPHPVRPAAVELFRRSFDPQWVPALLLYAIAPSGPRAPPGHF